MYSATSSALSSNDALVDVLHQQRQFTSPRIGAAMKAVDRSCYVPAHQQRDAYFDCPLVIGYGATISAPHIHAVALQQMERVLIPGARVLDVGSGSGYLTAVIAHLIKPNGRVNGIEHIPQLVQQSISNINSDPQTQPLMNGPNPVISITCGDARISTATDTATTTTTQQQQQQQQIYNGIHVGAAAASVPLALIAQLAVGGIMVCPCESPTRGNAQQLLLIERHSAAADGWTQRVISEVRFVPLTSADRQLQMEATRR